jgi:hypothetical protein
MDILYNNFVEYFGNPCLTKIKQEANGLSIYCVQIFSMLSYEKKYLVVMAYDGDNSPLRSFKFLDSIRWEVIQTKIYKKDFSTMTHDYTINKNLSFFRERIERAADYIYIYKTNNFGMNITINKIIPNNSITLGAAIELYDTTIMISKRQ